MGVTPTKVTLHSREDAPGQRLQSEDVGVNKVQILLEYLRGIRVCNDIAWRD
jgi:hypothetical protein